MPDTRTLGTPRSPISREGGTIGKNGNLNTRGSIGTTRTVASGITSEAQAPGMPQSEISRINDLIVKNAGQYLSTQFVTPTQSQGNLPNDASGGVPLPKNPFEVLADSLMRAFGSSAYNPPLQQQSYGYGTSSGANFPLLIIIGAIGIGVYLYFKN